MKIVKILLATKNKECIASVRSYFNDHEVVEILSYQEGFNCDYDIAVCDKENIKNVLDCSQVFLLGTFNGVRNLDKPKISLFLYPFNCIHIEMAIMNVLKQTRVDINKLLIDLGVSEHLSGYKYIKAAIYLYKETNKLTEIYQKIANTYRSSISNVERQIRYAIEQAWTKADMDIVDELFSYVIDFEKAKPTNKQFIAILSKYS